jgi:hypothetical protein
MKKETSYQLQVDVVDFSTIYGLESTHIAKPRPLNCHQWFKNGDHPRDASTMVYAAGQEPFLSEGLVVRRFNHPALASEDVCPKCNKTFGEHGWIDQPKAHTRVCPGDWVCTFIDNVEVDTKNNYFVLADERFANHIAALPDK